jgi:hypothetical protein
MMSIFRINYVKKFCAATAVFLSSSSVVQADPMLGTQDYPHYSSNNRRNIREFIETVKLQYICYQGKKAAETLFQNNPNAYLAFKNQCGWTFFSDYIGYLYTTINDIGFVNLMSVGTAFGQAMGGVKGAATKNSKNDEGSDAFVKEAVKKSSFMDYVKSASGTGVALIKEHPYIAGSVVSVTLATGAIVYYYHSDETGIISSKTTCDEAFNYYHKVSTRSDTYFALQHQNHISTLIRQTAEGKDFTQFLEKCAKDLFP